MANPVVVVQFNPEISLRLNELARCTGQPVETLTERLVEQALEFSRIIRG